MLGQIATEVPLCRTRRLAGLLFDAMSPERPPAWWGGNALEDDEDWIGDPDAIAAFLFSVDPDRTRVLLRGWANLPNPVIHKWARYALIHAGDPSVAEQILAWTAPGGTLDDQLPSVVLGRSDCAAIRGWLRREATEADDEYTRTNALQCLALLQGWPTHVPIDRPEEPGAVWKAVTEAILGERVNDALSAWPWSKWLADHAIDPGGAPVRKRIGRSALGGDRMARASFWSAMRAGRYRWIHHNSEGDTHTLGRDPQTLPHWVADLDSNCCRISDGMSLGVFGDPYLDPMRWDGHSLYFAKSQGVGRPPSQHALDLFRLTGGEWVWSPIQDRWSIGLSRASRQERIPAPE